MARITIPEIQGMKSQKKIVVMTAYDYQMARLIDRADVEMILIGDSGGRNLLGHEDNNYVTLDEMLLMTRSVSRGAKRALVVGDMPFMTYQVSKEDAIRNAARIIQEGGAQAVKLEVGAEYASTVEAIVKAGIPVMAHMGLTPMTAIGSNYRSERVRLDDERVWRDARALESAGAFCLLLTRVPPELAKKITEEIRIPTISGFGSGDDCDGQIGVTHGTVGFTVEQLDHPRSPYGPVAVPFFEAVKKFCDDVRSGKPVRASRDRAEGDS
jgi:3-methyl-2-oxobutanoate hydroxymethyltransferase